MLPDRRLIFLNRAVQGNTVAEMSARWQKDTLDLKPDILSILIGINDVKQGISAEQYGATYDKLLADTVAALPNVRLVLGQPFTLRVNPHVNDWKEWRAKVQEGQDLVAKLATKYHAAFVPYQNVFEKACARAPADYWIWDAVHPTYSGHQLMEEEWIRTVKKFWPK
jgi:lysophospholipase L1-like esterase